MIKKINYSEFEKIILGKLANDGGSSEHIMLNRGIMKLWLSEKNDGIRNSRYSLNCEFKILYAIYEKAVSLGGTMYLGASAAHGGKRIGDKSFPVDTIDGFISLNFYGKKLKDSTLRRSTYYAAVLDWAGFAKNHRGGYITVNKAAL